MSSHQEWGQAMRCQLSCTDFERLGIWEHSRCCASCHRELARGIFEIETTAVANAHGKDPRVQVVVCCNFVLAPTMELKPQAFNRDLFAATLRAKRAARRRTVATNAACAS